jgi:hypothetical protein
MVDSSTNRVTRPSAGLIPCAAVQKKEMAIKWPFLWCIEIEKSESIRVFRARDMPTTPKTALFYQNRLAAERTLPRKIAEKRKDVTLHERTAFDAAHLALTALGTDHLPLTQKLGQR